MGAAQAGICKPWEGFGILLQVRWVAWEGFEQSSGIICLVF